MIRGTDKAKASNEKKTRELIETVTAIRGMQVVDQTRESVVVYQGAALTTGKDMRAHINILTPSGNFKDMASYDDHDRAKRIIEEIRNHYIANDDLYILPAE